jgi:hypothetical protein
MRHSVIMAIGMAAVLCFAGTAPADIATWDVATVHGFNEFTISPDGSSLHYNQQGWTDYQWYENNGSAPGTVATTTAGPHAPTAEPRSGMRTFAVTDAALGQKLKDLKLVFDYKNSLGGYPTVNFFMTDGAGKFGIFAPTSLGIGTVGGTVTLDADWTRMTIDLTQASIPDTTNVAVYEHNGLAADKIYPYTTMQWGDIKDLTIAGPYDYQRSPTNGWSYWGEMFDEINTAGNSTLVNGYGLALIWGDTANSSNAYGSAQREIRNVSVTFGGTEYTGEFVNAQLPEPGTLVLLGMGGLGLLGYAWRRR